MITAWTTFRRLTRNELTNKRLVCQGDWPVDAKGKLKPCPNLPIYVCFAVGGRAHGLSLVMCEPCMKKFTDPNFDWEGPEKARC